MVEQYDLAIIGAGPGGYVAAIRAAQLGLKTVCIDKRKELGGTCLNVGCIPSKALLQSSEYYYKALHEFKTHGIESPSVSCNLQQMMKRKTEILSSFNLGIAGLFKKNKVQHIVGSASFTSPHTLLVTGGVAPQEIAARFILIATGSEPIALPFLPFDEKRILSSTGALSLDVVPRKMLVIGAGVIGVELGSVYSRLGSEVTFIEFFPRICPTLDESLSKELLSCLQKQGMQFHLASKVVAATVGQTEVTLQVTLPNHVTQEMSGDVVLVCIGRKPYTQGLNLDKAGITPTEKGFIPITSSFRTRAPHIFAIGDLVDGPMLAHKASEEGVAVAEIIAEHTPKIEYMAIPNVVYTHPEVASVGLSEKEAQDAGLQTKTGSFPFKASSKAKCAQEEEGFVKIVVETKTERIIGVHIIGAHAAELIAQGALAIQNKLTLSEIINTPYAHPTFSEALKEAALAVMGRAIHK